MLQPLPVTAAAAHGGVQELSLDKNQLSGPIPAELRQMEALQYLSLNANQQLTGQEAFQDHTCKSTTGPRG